MGFREAMRQEQAKTEAKKVRKEAERAEKGAGKRHEDFERSLAQARAAKEAGLRYFQLILSLEGSVLGKQKRGVEAILTEVERDGWQLVTAGYVYRSVGSMGGSVGDTIGIYLYRRVE